VGFFIACASKSHYKSALKQCAVGQFALNSCAKTVQKQRKLIYLIVL